MGPKHRRPLLRMMGMVVAFCAAVLLGLDMITTAEPPDATLQAQPTIPLGRATSDLYVPSDYRGENAETAWRRVPISSNQRATGTISYDNGMPLNDFGQPASQLSLLCDECALSTGSVSGACGLCPLSPTGTTRPEFIGFSAAAADDFILQDFTSPDTNVQITMIKAAFIFQELGASMVDPMATWTQGIDVTVYANTSLRMPAGAPVGDGTFTNFVQTVNVPSADLTVTPINGCFNFFVVEIPIPSSSMFVVAKNIRYWLSLVPRFPAPPQCFWMLSEENHGFLAHRGADFGPAFWNEIMGNESSFICPNAPPAFTKTDLSFQIFGTDLPSSMVACCDESAGVCQEMAPCAATEVAHPGATCQFVNCTPITGACCDDNNPTGCMDNVNIADCAPSLRFTPNVTCANLSPPCGTTDLGACCFLDQTCQDLNPTDCSNMGGSWNVGNCGAPFNCPTANDDCNSAVLLSTGTIHFDTRGAVTDGPADSPGGLCTNVNQDIWFRYVATCDGQMFVSLCMDTNYDAALAVYDGCACNMSLGPRLACDNDFCSIGGPAALSTAVQAGACYLIRVGGAGTAVGTGTLSVACVPDLVCCPGDVNGDGILDISDADLLISVLLSPPPSGTAAFCQADVNADGAVNGLDIQPLADLLISQAPCPSPVTGACCDSGQNCTVTSLSVCFAGGGIYQGDGTACTVNSCLPPTITCCLGDLNSDGSLDIFDVPLMISAVQNPPLPGTVTFCAADVNEDGAVNGDDLQVFTDRIIGGVSCIPPVTGACCLPDGTCLQDTLSGCSIAAGTYQGDNTVCTPNLCTQPLLIDCCLGDFNSDGIVDTLDVAGFVNATLNPPLVDSPDFCRANVNLDGSVDGSDIDGFVALVLNQTLCPPPANDNCANAKLLSCNSRIALDNSLATTDAGDPAFSCHIGGPAQGAGSLWFSFVAIDTTALISTCDSFPPVTDTLLAVYSTSCPTAGNEIACSEDAGGACGRLSELCVGGLTPGQTYTIQVSSFDSGSLGFIAMKIVCPCP